MSPSPRRGRPSGVDSKGRITLKKLFFGLALAGVLLAATIAGPASAATPCWRLLINDWWDGRIDRVYEVRCYEQAMEHAGEDLGRYSDLEEDLKRALQGVLRGQNGKGGGGTRSTTARVPAGSKGHDLEAEDHQMAPSLTVTPPPGDSGRDEPKGAFKRALDFLGPNNASSIPLPLLFLAGLAFLLMAAGATGMVTRRVQERRVATRSAAPPPSPDA